MVERAGEDGERGEGGDGGGGGVHGSNLASGAGEGGRAEIGWVGNWRGAARTGGSGVNEAGGDKEEGGLACRRVMLLRFKQRL